MKEYLFSSSSSAQYLPNAVASRRQRAVAVGFVDGRRPRIVASGAVAVPAVAAEVLGYLRLASVEPHRPRRVAHATVNRRKVPRAEVTLARLMVHSRSNT